MAKVRCVIVSVTRLSRLEIHELKLEPGLVVKQEFFNFILMQESSKIGSIYQNTDLIVDHFMVVMTVYICSIYSLVMQSVTKV